MAQGGRLGRDRVHPPPVRVAERVDGDTGRQVEEGAAGRVGQAGALPRHKHHVGRAGVGLEDVFGFPGDDVRSQGVGGGGGGRGGGRGGGGGLMRREREGGGGR